MSTRLIDKATGAETYVEDADLPAALASQKYVAPDAVAVHRFGQDTYAAPDVAEREQLVSPTIDPARAAIAHGHALRAARNSGALSAVSAGLSGVVSGFTGGLVTPDAEAEEFNSGIATGGKLVGAIAPMLVGDDAGIAALLADPAEVERAAGGLSSRMLFGGEVGAEAGTAGKVAERGLLGAKDAIDGAGKVAAVPDDLAGLDAGGLRGARDAELARIETERVPQRAQLADDLAAFRSDLKDQKLWLATKGADDADVRAIGKRTLKADRQLDNLLDNPKRLAEKPELAKAALQQQEAALETLAKKSDELRASFVNDTSGTRAAALEAVPAALERNRALQARIGELVAEPASTRLQSIDAAKDALSAPAEHKSLAEDMLGGSIMGHVAGALSGLPIVGPMLGAKAGRLASDLVFGKLGKVTAEAGARTAKTVAAIVDTAKASVPTLPIAASKVLSSVRFGASDAAAAGVGKAAKAASSSSDLAHAFAQRTAEIKAQTMYDATGTPVMRPDARAALASRLAALRSMGPRGPMLADRLETLAARRIEYLSSVIPRKPDIGGVPTGPDLWRPSDMEMRAFARRVHAVEHPESVEERLVDGSLTPEDVEAYRAVYPERATQLERDIFTELPKLQKQLPYHRRLALSIFTGQSIDPALDPQILTSLQGHFAKDEGGGDSSPMTQPEMAQPAFGSVKSDLGTLSQQREGRTA